MILKWPFSHESAGLSKCECAGAPSGGVYAHVGGRSLSQFLEATPERTASDFSLRE